MIGAALLGAGIFSKDVYANVFEQNKDKVALRKVWSRSSESAEAFVTQHANTAIASHGDEGLLEILQDPEIQLVVVVLPVQVALKVVKQALTAGKHVIEEKPVAGTTEAALAAIQEYRAVQKAAGSGSKQAPLWMVAENFRYEQVFKEACELAPSVLGTVIKLDLIADLPMDQNNKYYGSQWRRDTEGCPGGMVMDSGVHFIAALRMLAHACGLGEATAATARTHHAKPDLSGPDSVVGVVSFQGGSAPASVSISLAAHHVHWSLRAVGTEGSLEVSRGGWGGSRGAYTLSWKKISEAQPCSKQVSFTGIPNEFASFLRMVSAHSQGGSAAVLGTQEELVGSPEEGARDLAMIEALLLSGALGGSTVRVPQI